MKRNRKGNDKNVGIPDGIIEISFNYSWDLLLV